MSKESAKIRVFVADDAPATRRVIQLGVESEGGSARSCAAPQATAEPPQTERVFVEGDDAMVLDLESFKHLLGGDMEIVCSILGEFIECAEICYAEAYTAFQQADYDVARARFHKLAGSCAAVFASQLHLYALNSERLLVDAVYGEQRWSPLFAAIDSCLPRLRAEIKQITTSGS